MKAVRTYETSLNSTILQGATSQKTDFRTDSLSPFRGADHCADADRGMARSDGTSTVNQPIPWGTNVTWPPSERRKLLVTISKQD